MRHLTAALVALAALFGALPATAGEEGAPDRIYIRADTDMDGRLNFEERERAHNMVHFRTEMRRRPLAIDPLKPIGESGMSF